MVHDEKQRRYFKNNLFLAPLQGLKNVLRKGTVGELVHYESVQPPEKYIKKTFQLFLQKNAFSENPKKDKESKLEYNKRIQKEFIHPVESTFKKILSEVKGELEDPEELLGFLLEYTKSSEEMFASLTEFKNNSSWAKAVSKYRAALKNAEDNNTKIQLKAEAATRSLPNLFLNQRDSQGVFYYEPSLDLSKAEDDLSYVIQLEDMITVKNKRRSSKIWRISQNFKIKKSRIAN